MLEAVGLLAPIPQTQVGLIAKTSTVVFMKARKSLVV